MAQLYRVLYCSRNRLAGAPETYNGEVQHILAKSRENNVRDGVTGGLLFSEGCFAQVLEGPVGMVETTFERIQCDSRHGDVTVLECTEITARDFPDWSMAFTGTDASPNPLAGGALTAAFTGHSSAGGQVLTLLRQVIVRENDWLVAA
jgi:hypothetical protein